MADDQETAPQIFGFGVPLSVTDSDVRKAMDNTRPWYVKKFQQHKVPILCALAVVFVLCLALGLGLGLSPAATRKAAAPAAPVSEDPNAVIATQPTPIVQKFALLTLSETQQAALYALAVDTSLEGKPCEDDPQGILKMTKTTLSCDSLAASGMCEVDVSVMSPLAPPGTYISQFCSLSCGACGDFTTAVWESIPMDCAQDIDCRKADPKAVCVHPLFVGKCQCSQYFSGQYCQYEPAETVVDNLANATGPSVLVPSNLPVDPRTVCPAEYCPVGYEMMETDSGSTAKESLGQIFSGFPNRRPARTDPTADNFEAAASLDSEDPAVIKPVLKSGIIRFKGLVPINTTLLFWNPEVGSKTTEVAIRLHVPNGIDPVDLVKDQFKSFMVDKDMFNFQSPGIKGEGFTLVMSSGNFHRFGYSIMRGINARVHMEPTGTFWNATLKMFSPVPHWPLKTASAQFSVIIRGYYPLAGGVDAWGDATPSVDVLVPMVRLNMADQSFLGQPVSTILRAGKAQIRINVNTTTRSADPFLFSEMWFSFPKDNSSYLHCYATISLGNNMTDITVNGGIYDYKLFGLEKWLRIDKVSMQAKTQGLSMPIKLDRFSLSMKASLQFGGVSNQPLKIEAMYIPQSQGAALYGFELTTGQMVITDMGAMACSFLPVGCSKERAAQLTAQLGSMVNFEATASIANGDIELANGKILYEGFNLYSAGNFETPDMMKSALAAFNTTGALTGARSSVTFGFNIPLSVQKIQQAIAEDGSVDVNMVVTYDIKSNDTASIMPFTLDLLSVRIGYKPLPTGSLFFIDVTASIQVKDIKSPLVMRMVAGYDGSADKAFLNLTQINKWQAYPFLALQNMQGRGFWLMGSSPAIADDKRMSGFNFSTEVILGFSKPIVIQGFVDPIAATVEMTGKAAGITANLGDLFRMVKTFAPSTSSPPTMVMEILDQTLLTDLDFRLSPQNFVFDNLPKGIYVGAKLQVWGGQVDLVAEVHEVVDVVDVVVKKLNMSKVKLSMISYLQPANSALTLMSRALGVAAGMCPTCSITVCINSCSTVRFAEVAKSLSAGLDSLLSIDSLSISSFSMKAFTGGLQNFTISLTVTIMGEQLSGSMEVPISFFKDPVAEAGKYVGQLADSMFKNSASIKTLVNNVLANMTIRLNDDDQNPLNVIFSTDTDITGTTVAAKQVGHWVPMASIPALSISNSMVAIGLQGSSVSKALLTGTVNVGLTSGLQFNAGLFKNTNPKQLGVQAKFVGKKLSFGDIAVMGEYLSGSKLSPLVSQALNSVFLTDFVLEFSPEGVDKPEMKIPAGFKFVTKLDIFGATLDVRAEMVNRNVSGVEIKDFEFVMLLTNLTPSLIPFLQPYDNIMISFGEKMDGFAKYCPNCVLEGCLGNNCKSVTLQQLADFVKQGLDGVFHVNEIGIAPFSLYNLQLGGKIELVLNCEIMGIPITGSIPVGMDVFTNFAGSLTGGRRLAQSIPFPSIPSTSGLANAVKSMGLAIFGEKAAEISNAIFQQFTGNVSLRMNDGYQDDDLTIAFQGQFKETMEFDMTANQVGVWRPYNFLALKDTSVVAGFSKADGLKAALLSGTLEMGGNPLHFSGGLNAVGNYFVNISATNSTVTAGNLMRMASNFRNVMNSKRPATCAEIAANTAFGLPKSGYYAIQPIAGESTIVKVFCDMSDFPKDGMVWTLCGKYDRDNKAHQKFLTRDFGRTNQNSGDLSQLDMFTSAQASYDCRSLAGVSTKLMAASSDGATGVWASKAVIDISGLGLNQNMWDTFMDSTAATCFGDKPAHRYNNIFFGAKVVVSSLLDDLMITDVSVYAEMGGPQKSAQLRLRMEIWAATIDVKANVIQRTVGESRVSTLPGACKSGYTGTFSALDAARFLCAQRCFETAECKYFAYCDGSDMESCVGEHMNKCAIYTSSTCEVSTGSAGQWTGYKAYQIGSTNIIDIQLEKLSLSNLKSSFIPYLKPATSILASVAKQLDTVGHACPSCTLGGCIGQWCVKGTAAELATAIKANMDDWLILNELSVSPISLYEMQQGQAVVINLDASILGVKITGSMAVPGFLMDKINNAALSVGMLGDKSFKKSDDTVASVIYKNFASVTLQLSDGADPLNISFSGAFRASGHFSLAANQIGVWRPLYTINPGIGLSLSGLAASVDFTQNGLEKVALSGTLRLSASASLPFQASYNGYTGENFATLSLTSGVTFSTLVDLAKAINPTVANGIPSIPDSDLITFTQFDLKISSTGIPKATCNDLDWITTGTSCNGMVVKGTCKQNVTFDAAKRFCGQIGARLCSTSELSVLSPPAAASSFDCFGSLTGYYATRLNSDGTVSCIGTGATCSAACNAAGAYTASNNVITCTADNALCQAALKMKGYSCAQAATRTAHSSWESVRDFTIQVTTSDTLSIVMSPQASTQGEIYQITQNATQTAINRNFNSDTKKTASFAAATSRALWVSYIDGTLSIGLGKKVGASVITSFTDPNPLDVQYLSIAVVAGGSVRYEQLCATAQTPIEVCSTNQAFWSHNSGCALGSYQTQGAQPYSTSIPAACRNEAQTAAAMCCIDNAVTVPKGIVVAARASIWGVTTIYIKVSMALIPSTVPASIPNDLSVDTIQLTGCNLAMLPAIQNAAAVLDGVADWIRANMRICAPEAICSIIPSPYDSQCKGMLCTDVVSSILSELVSWVKDTMISVLQSVVTLNIMEVKQFFIGQIAKNVGTIPFLLDMTVIGIRIKDTFQIHVSDLTSIAKGQSAVKVLGHRLMTSVKNDLVNSWTKFGTICRAIASKMCINVYIPAIIDQKVCLPMPC